MAARWSDEQVAASLNRMGMRTGQGKSWTAHRVYSIRRVHGIHAYRSAEKGGEWLTMSEAAASLGVNAHVIRRLIRDGILPAEQVVPDAPWQIKAADLHHPRVAEALATRHGPRRAAQQDELPIFQPLEKEGYNERVIAMPLSPRSAALLERQTRPSSRNRVKDFQRLSM